MLVTKLGTSILEACQRKAERDGMKRYSVRALERATGINQSHLSRIIHGQVNSSREILTKICTALECTPQERADIFHAAGYLSPEEMEEDEESHIAA
jgi:DNA-binding Xre family transcriptional regulator